MENAQSFFDDVRTDLDIEIRVDDPLQLPNEAIIALPYCTTHSKPGLFVIRGATIGMIRFNQMGFLQYRNAGMVWGSQRYVAETADVESLYQHVLQARKTSDSLGAAFITRGKMTEEDDLLNVAKETLLCFTLRQQQSRRPDLDTLRDRMIPDLVDRSYDPATAEGFRRRVQGVERLAYAVDVPGSIIPVLRRNPETQDAIFLGSSTGFTASDEAILTVLGGARALRSLTGSLKSDVAMQVSGNTARIYSPGNSL